MPDEPQLLTGNRIQKLADDLAVNRPDVQYMAPYMAFLLLLPLDQLLPYSFRPVAIAIRGGASLWLFWLFRLHYPRLGKPHWIIATIVGLAVAWGWAAGQHFFDGMYWGEHSFGGKLIIFSGHVKPDDPRQLYGPISDFSWWSQVVLRIAVSATAVPIVEEIFWRGFMLRAFIDWDRFYAVPFGKFTWLSFMATSVISILEHPDNWAVSILCWIVYNGLMCWKKSLLCLMITHGITNLALYIYVIRAHDWQLW